MRQEDLVERACYLVVVRGIRRVCRLNWIEKEDRWDYTRVHYIYHVTDVASGETFKVKSGHSFIELTAAPSDLPSHDPVFTQDKTWRSDVFTKPIPVIHSLSTLFRVEVQIAIEEFAARVDAGEFESLEQALAAFLNRAPEYVARASA
jgi:hypothetical protein